MLDITTLLVTPIAQNCRILAHQESSDAVIVDPGGDSNTIISFIEQANLKPIAILLTHGHIDHVGASAQLKEHFKDIRIIGPHKDEEPILETLAHQSSIFGVPLEGSFQCEYVKDNEVINLFKDASLKVLHTPGHTPGGVCYYCQEENFVLTGDTLFASSIGRTDFYLGNTAQLFDSIKEKLLTLPDEVEVMSGHGEDSTIGYERQNNPYLANL